MELGFFVTCGRGFDHFVVREIKDKLSGAFNVVILGEGKVSFQIVYSDVKELTCIYQLKLVERMFILLYYENININSALICSEGKVCFSTSVSNVIDGLKQKFQEVIDTKDWRFLTSTIKSLKEHYTELCGIRNFCNNPQTCPASLDKKESREKLLNVRLQKSKRKNTYLESNETKNSMNQNKKSEYESKCGVRKLKPDICATNDTDNMNIKPSISCENINSEGNISYSNFKRLKANEYFSTSNQESDCIEDRPNTKTLGERYGSATVDDEEVPQEKPVNESTDGHPLFRVSSRVSGLNKKKLPNGWATKTFIDLVQEELKWQIGWNNPLLDFYINITDIHHIIGLSLVESPLSCRNYIRHLTLRSTVCALMINFAQPAVNSTLLDPMCGSGIILLEAATNLKIGHVIGCDLSESQLSVALCNLSDIKTTTTLIHASVTCLPLRNCSIDAVVCDFPFGKKHCLVNPDLLACLLEELSRVVVFGGRVVLLVSLQQEMQLKELLQGQTSQGLTFMSSHKISLGETSACICIISKIN